ncbi:STAS domain-containing protein [Streptomyces sp. NPDC058371]|jgi:anti-anti-sigma factor|uniref:STAS domain-containing protein n=1 Tax=Streptomyces sp. NPDC058371 TaxID=3346463 RepID=UPI00364D4BFB
MTFSPNPRDLPNCTLLTLPAEIDISNADLLYAETMDLVHARTGRLRVLVLDLTGTRFMDSQGVRLLDQVRHRVHHPPRTELRVAVDPEGMAGRVLNLTGLRRDVAVYDDLAEAVSS